MKEIIFSGKVVHGKKFGRILGFPTANLDRRDYGLKKINARFGIWAGTVTFPNSKIPSKETLVKSLTAAIVIGPLDSRGLPKLEAHILDFNETIYGEKITFHLKKFVRPYKEFKTLEQLKQQIQKDITIIKRVS